METLNRLKIENFLSTNSEKLSGSENTLPELMDIIENNDDDNNRLDDDVEHRLPPPPPCGTPCGIMSLGQALQKENICPYGGATIKSNKNSILSDDSSCGTSPMSDADHPPYGSNNLENRKCVTDPIPIPP